MFENILQEIRSYDRIIIHRHSNPDGDALGSQIGLKHIIRESFPEKEVYAVGDSSKRFSFIEDSVMDEVADEMYESALAVILDTSASSLISDARYKTAKRTVRMDHHIFCERIADVELTDTSYESCCGLVADFARKCGLAVNQLAAKSLYTGMITDSGRFRYDSTTSKTFEIAAFLMERKFTTEDIYRNLYADDFSRIRLRAEFVMKIKFSEKNVAYIYTTLDEARATGEDTFTISRGMVNTMGDIRGVDIWVNFTEADDGVLCEIRSSKYNINPIAVKHGGGGHAKASGATLKDREEALEMISELEELIGG
ncbi:MAG: bifunctional oligoribonuclease/PAP phosphatase NrnA [Ruminococcaceae bacterium]|nr:bifunctional oligoribonuclease/PAP phosphatase NrnA [Oscillospiraceae bacterium]